MNEKFAKLIGTLFISIAVIVAAHFLGDAYKDKNRINDTIEVTGLGKKDFDADLVVWRGSFSSQNMELQQANSNLNRDREYLKKYLIENGIDPEEMVFEAININPQFEYVYDENSNSHREFRGYKLEQTVIITARNDQDENRIEVVERVSREVTDIINAGIEFHSYAPQYYFTQLEELKIEMIAAATENATERAEQIAENSGVSLGDLKNARMGVFQILGRHMNEEYSWGGTFNTSSKEKTAQITMKLKFEIDG